LDPFELSQRIEEKLEAIYELAHGAEPPWGVRFPARARRGETRKAGVPHRRGLEQKNASRMPRDQTIREGDDR